jgi:hypothetical protein
VRQGRTSSVPSLTSAVVGEGVCVYQTTGERGRPCVVIGWDAPANSTHLLGQTYEGELETA